MDDPEVKRIEVAGWIMAWGVIAVGGTAIIVMIFRQDVLGSLLFLPITAFSLLRFGYWIGVLRRGA